MSDVVDVLRITWENLTHLALFFFFALFVSALVDLLYLDVIARRSFKRHGLRGIVLTTCVGAFSPLCSLTVIPLIHKLLRVGVPLSAVMSFWIASPTMDPEIFALTGRAVGVPLALARLVGALVLALTAGVVVLWLERRGHFKDVLRPEPQPQPVAAMTGEGVAAPRQAVIVGVGPTGSSLEASPRTSRAELELEPPNPPEAHAVSIDDDDGTPWWTTAKASLRSRRNWRITGRNILRDTVGLGKWLVFACAFEGVIRVYVPSEVISGVLGGAGLVAIPLAVLISVPLYLNGVGAIPVVAGLIAKGMAPGAAVSFLLAGALTTIPAMVAVRSVVNNRVFALYLGFGIVGSIILGLLAQPLLG